MILIADSGSSKCDWLLIKDAEYQEFKTMGFNPMFHSTEVVINEINKHSDLSVLASKINHVFYYGASCNGPTRVKIIDDALGTVFINAEISVDHDLTGAVYATCNGKPGIACILGTGSNSAFFDGTQIHEEVPALGYILGDEGSGAYFGKKLLTDFLYKDLPKHIEKQLIEATQVTKDIIFQNVYMKPHANVYLASFMRFLTQVKDEPYVKDLIYKGISTFIDIHIWNYENHRVLPVHFIGSVAFFHQEVLERACASHRIKLGNIVRKPIYNLAKHHAAKLNIAIPTFP